MIATVLIFFSAHCACMEAHDARLAAIERRYTEHGVRFLLVDSEFDAAPERDRLEAEQRGYGAPILSDPEGRLADRYGARYATFTVVLDAEGRVLYRGGLDSDRIQLHADADRYLERVLDAVLAGRAPPLSEAKALGCALRRW
jgi:hypothetical protein